MSQSRKKLIPNAALIYENVDGVVYARYRDAPHNQIPRWIIGGKLNNINKYNYNIWKDICDKSEFNPTLKSQLDKLLNMYYIVKDNDKKEA